MISLFPVKMAFALAIGASFSATAADAQESDRPVMMTVTVAGQPDSLFRQFVSYLGAHGGSITAADMGRRTLTANLESVKNEGVRYRFAPQRDSTTIVAQGTRGGMLAALMGMGVVNEWLEGPRSRPDTSSAAAIRQPPPRLEQRPN